MAARSIASILHTLTSEEYVRSENSDSNEMETLIAEYFTGNYEVTDNDETESKAETLERGVNYCNFPR